MSRRIAHNNSPDAPELNSLVPSVNNVAPTRPATLLLIRHTGNGNGN
ncbi:hypothetical protein [Nonomuraea longicatena]